jgi:hypothetical protein
VANPASLDSRFTLGSSLTSAESGGPLPLPIPRKPEQKPVSGDYIVE